MTESNVALERRLELHQILVNLLGSNNVYFQPPATIKISYPCIIYERSSIAHSPADNIKYSKYRRYSITLIEKDPDSIYLDKLLELPYCSYDRHYTSDNLHHDAFTIYY